MAIPARLCPWLPAAAVAALALASCRSGGDHWWSIRRSPQQEMLRALEAEDPDVRRQAIARVVESGQVTSDWAFDGLDAMARTDPDSQVRSTGGCRDAPADPACRSPSRSRRPAGCHRAVRGGECLEPAVCRGACG
jgi:hypothetical protein